MDCTPRDKLTPAEAERAIALVSKHGLHEAARLLGVSAQTLPKALLQIEMHRLTVCTIRARLAETI